ncbi:MAG: histidine triad nucleotide-binding protein [Dehalococcoidia bacterium]
MFAPPLLEERGSGGEVNKDCIFCRIISGEVESKILYQDEDVVAFRDINPQAPTHLLIIPRAHITSPAEVSTDQERLLGHLIQVASELAKGEGIAESGYRLVLNSGPDSGQEIAHLHLHLLGGHRLGRLG